MNNNNYGGHDPANDPARKAMEAARRAREHANQAKLEAEREDRLRRDQARENIPLVSPHKDQVQKRDQKIRPRRLQAEGQNGQPPMRRPQSAPGGVRQPQTGNGGRPARSPGSAGGNRNHNAANRRPHNGARPGPRQPQPALKGVQADERGRNSMHRMNHNQQMPPRNHQVVEQAGKGALIFGRVIFILLAAISLAVIVVMFVYNVLPTKYRLVIAVTIVIINVIVFYLLYKGQYSRSSRIGGTVIGVLSLVILLGISYILYFTISTLDSLNIEYELVNYDIRVMADSPLQTLSDLNDVVIGVSSDEKDENLENAYKQLQSENNATFTTAKADNFIDNVGLLYTGETDAILFNSAHDDSITSVYPDFATETRILGTTAVKAPIKITANRVDTSREGFSMFISGIDTYGEISTVSRSDVNIVVTVNPKTKKILMTSIPRDAYVEIDGTNGGYDKLTHAGIFGIETSVNTVANFLDTDINYYSRVNFTSLIELVDILGGIEVENPVAFPTNDGSYYFEAGTIYLDGDQALAFSRERYNLAEGDVDRGRNQLRVIEGMIKKATSREALQNIGPLMDKFNEVAETNMPTPDIMNLVNVSTEGESWDIQKISLLGTGSTGLPSYGMPGSSLYMYVPDEESVLEIKEEITNILETQ